MPKALRTNTYAPCQILTNYIFLLHPVPHCPVMGLGRHGVYTLSTQPSQSSSPVPYCPVLLNQAPMTCHCAATEYTDRQTSPPVAACRQLCSTGSYMSQHCLPISQDKQDCMR